MSRPIKKGLSYFPLDTDILSDRKTRRLFQNYGCEGFSTYMAILCRRVNIAITSDTRTISALTSDLRLT